MSKALWRTTPAHGPADTSAQARRNAGGLAPGRAKLDWRKRMSDNVAYALLAYTALQIFVTMSALKTGHGSVLPYLALIVLVAGIIPACRAMEGRWSGLSDQQADNPELADKFKRDRLALWLCAIGLPFAITALLKGLVYLF